MHGLTRRGLALTALVLAVSTTAQGFEPSLRVDGAGLLPLSTPQTTYFGLGAQVTVSGGVEVAPFWDLIAGANFEVLPVKPGAPMSPVATGLGLSAGVRFKRPMADQQLLPWGALSLGWTQSGVNSFALQPALGLNLRTSPTSPLLFGPFVRFAQLFKMQDVAGFQSFDASLLAFGLSVEFAPRDALEASPPPAPLVTAARDTDGDGVPEDVDRCATSPEDKDGFQDDDGCPDPDNDADGVPDLEDACRDLKGSATAHGCPDSDGDGVADKDDACPRKAGRREDGGCPVYKEVVVTASRIEIKQKIFFAFGTATIMPKSHQLLAEVVQALQDRDAICVRIEGHTDNVGSADRNLKLSQERTQAVMDFLMAQGVRGARLSAKGYGSMLPLASNATPETRESNRRVEFVIVPCQDKE